VQGGKAPRANTWSDEAALRQRWFLPLQIFAMKSKNLPRAERAKKRRTRAGQPAC
jgi:hypothetical protein